MGVSNASKTLYTTSELSLDDLLVIGRHKREAMGRKGRPKIDIDASVYGYKLARRPGGSIAAIVKIMTKLAMLGFDVAVVCDGDKRHHSKRASIEQTAAREGARIASIIMRGELLSVAEELQNGNFSDVEKVELTARREISWWKLSKGRRIDHQHDLFGRFCS
ncbi:MAG: hypothetical protein ACREOZ_03855 [Gloeomargaritales cyanobacterium]